jgi:hypothetical protein
MGRLREGRDRLPKPPVFATGCWLEDLPKDPMARPPVMDSGLTPPADSKGERAFPKDPVPCPL